MTIVVAMDKFRGTLSAGQACAAVADGVRQAGYDATSVPMSDGGEGFLDAFGGANRKAPVTGPQGVPVDAEWRLDSGRALIESAAACGLALLDPARPRDPLAATSRGVGELIGAALAAGARDIWVGVGGTACTDGGAGALEALGAWLPAGATALPAALTVLVDVTTRFNDAAPVFGPQKGASPGEVEILTRRLTRQARTYQERFGRRIDELAGSGAGGGLAGGLAAIGGGIRSGFDAIAEFHDLETLIKAADLVITGEGRVDPPSLQGKVVGGVLRMAAGAGVPALVLAGTVADDMPPVRGATVRSLTAEYGPRRAWHDTAAALAELTAAWLSQNGTTQHGAVR
jgi:glycerate kinase